MLDRPEVPEPHTLEVEVTNACSARCSFCPHPRMTRMQGKMDLDRFTQLLDQIAQRREEFWLNLRAGTPLFPSVVFAGLGEPTLHPELDRFVAACAKRCFSTRVVTNGAHLTDSLVESLLNAGLGTLAISLHSLQPEVFQRLMGLPLDGVLPRVLRTLEHLRDTPVRLEVWRVLAPPREKQRGEGEEGFYKELQTRFPLIEILGPSEPWERDGSVPESRAPMADDSAETGIWCHNFFFKESVAWDGRIALCCVDFHRLTAPINNIFEVGFNAVLEQRRALFRSAQRFPICSSCRKWPDSEYRTLYERFLFKNSEAAGLDPDHVR